MIVDANTTRRIVIVRIGKIGDLIVANFAIRKIRSAFPSSVILLVTLPRNREVLRYSKDIDRVRFFHKGADILSLILTLRRFHPDLLLDFNDNPSRTSSLIARFGGAKLRIGFAFEETKKHLSVGVECPDRKQTHITERIRKIPEAVGLKFDEKEIVSSLALGEKETHAVSEHLARISTRGKFLIAVNVSAGSPTRYWRIDRWNVLLREIHRLEPETFFLMLSLEEEKNLARSAAEALPSSRVIFPVHYQFHYFASYIAQSDLLISPDTSAIHIACSVQVPVLGLYPDVEWNYQSWRPIGTEFETVRPGSGDVSNIETEGVLKAYRTLRARVVMKSSNIMKKEGSTAS